MIKTYYLLTKPGIIFGNLITTVGGFALASKGHFDLMLFIPMFLGLGCVIASACVFNNYIDRASDAKMARTKDRALAKGAISPRDAILFAAALGVIGVAVLCIYTNLLAAGLAFSGFAFYVLLYSFSKSRTTHATLIGSVAGAMPPVVGYCAASNRIDAGAIILFAILVLWQMPHFYSIALYRFDDYFAASIPVLPVKKGIPTTKVQMLLYIAAFAASAVALMVWGYVGVAYLVVAVLMSAAWGWLCIKGFKADNDRVWARNMFRLSLVVIMSLSAMISFDGIG